MLLHRWQVFVRAAPLLAKRKVTRGVAYAKTGASVEDLLILSVSSSQRVGKTHVVGELVLLADGAVLFEPAARTELVGIFAPRRLVLTRECPVVPSDILAGVLRSLSASLCSKRNLTGTHNFWSIRKLIVGKHCLKILRLHCVSIA